MAVAIGGVVKLVDAFILVKISRKLSHSARGMVSRFRDFEEVEQAEILFGDYDAVLKIRGEKIHDIENFVFDHLISMEGVESTTTMLCVDEGVLE